MSMHIDQTSPDFLEMSDDEIMNMSNPPADVPVVPDPGAAPPASAEPAAEPEAPGSDEQGDAGEQDPSAPADAGVDDEPPAPAGEPADGQDPAAPQAPAGNPEAGQTSEPAPSGDNSKPADEKPAAPTAEDYKAVYDRLLGQPIRANGKDIQLRSVEEAERLIQMGLNYTKKMQAWQPRMRMVTMLENNGLLDEAKLSYLIDLSKGNPSAIQKLLADSKFDPMEVDADKAASYTPNNHQVTDQEMAFNAVLDELEGSDTGVELITTVSRQWDSESKRAVFQDPQILRVINEQKALGLYDRITAEMDHLKTLGHLQGVPFLQAYKAVGDMLADQGRLRPEPQKKPTPAPVETRVAVPPPKVTNNAKAAAASPTKATPASPKTELNYLDVPDDEFVKQMGNRL